MLTKDQKRRIIADYETAVNNKERALAALSKARADLETVAAYAAMKGIKLPHREKVSIETGSPGHRGQEVNVTSNPASGPTVRKVASGLSAGGREC